MQIHYSLEDFRADDPIVTIGTFDGVHLGHREVIAELNRLSKSIGGQSVVFTFDPHPRLVLQASEDTLRLLNTLEEKIELMSQLEIDHLVVYPFDKSFAQLPYDRFVSEILVGKMGIQSLVVGYDHRFGQGRKGDFASLDKLSKSLHFKVEQLSQLFVDNCQVSSTKIRMALQHGDVTRASRYLGYYYQISGRVVTGKQLGRKLGFPTANIELFDAHKLVPADGVYAVWVYVDDELYRGMMNVGIRPTVNSNVDHKSIEVHLLDFDGDLYDKLLRVCFVEKIRDEQKFSGVDLLIDQLTKDKIAVGNILEHASTCYNLIK